MRLVKSAAFRAAAPRGFSLLELMLVIAIIGILMAVAAVNILGAGDRAKTQATKASLSTIKNSLGEYNLNHSSYPPDLRTLVSAKFLDDKALKDGWKKDFIYDARGRDKDHPFILGSSGPDGIVGNEDDIDIWTMNKD